MKSIFFWSCDSWNCWSPLFNLADNSNFGCFDWLTWNIAVDAPEQPAVNIKRGYLLLSAGPLATRIFLGRPKVAAVTSQCVLSGISRPSWSLRADRAAGISFPVAQSSGTGHRPCPNTRPAPPAAFGWSFGGGSPDASPKQHKTIIESLATSGSDSTTHVHSAPLAVALSDRLWALAVVAAFLG